MGWKTPDIPQEGAAAIVAMPFQQRVKTLGAHWGEFGFGVPKSIAMFYVIKMALYVILGVAIVGLTTPALGGFGEFTSWWTEPIVYLKLMMWTILFEITGLSSSSGPLAFKVSPLIGGILYYARPGTLRVPPWPSKVPFTSGDHRTVFDVFLYCAILANVVFLIVHPGGARMDLVPQTQAGLLPAWAFLTYLGLLCLMGLRDKVVFLTSRAEQYAAVILAFGILVHFTDMIVAAKIVICVSWVGAAVSKLGRHFSPAVAAMMANTMWMPTPLKRLSYRNHPTDMRPSKFASFMAHGPGTVLEAGLPLVLLFSADRTLTLLALVGMFAFHLFIVSTIPLAVPLEWNLFFMFSGAFLFWNFHAGEGYGLGDVSSPWLLAAMLVGMLIWPILGNLRPDLISFLVSYRQYAGNWASAVWAFRDKDAEMRIETHVKKSNAMHSTQLAAAFGEDLGEMFVQKTNAWRSMHSMGRALHSILGDHVDIDTARVREAETVCSALVGWQFGDGHLHDERLIEAVQRRCGYSPGDLVVVFTESEPIHRAYTEYRVIDAALGVVERGWYWTKDSSETQPWLPDGPIPYTVTWRMAGYVPESQLAEPQVADSQDTESPVADFDPVATAEQITGGSAEAQRLAAEVVDSADIDLPAGPPHAAHEAPGRYQQPGPARPVGDSAHGRMQE